MAIITQPDLLPYEFASGGDKNTIPANNDGTSGYASIYQGFPKVTQTALSSGGIPPKRADFNGIFNLFSKFIMYLQNGGMYKYNATLDYQPPALVADTSGNIFLCLKANGPSTDNGVKSTTNAEYWQNIGIATQVGKADVGSGINPIYLDEGKVVASGSSVGDTQTPICMINGILTACGNKVGAANNGGMTGWSFASNGWVKFANGFIIQWGKTNSGEGYFTFPVAFPNYILAAFALKYTTGDSGYVPWTRDWSKTGMSYGTGGSGASLLSLGY